MKFTMFTSTKEEKVLRGQKQYYLSSAKPPHRGSNVIETEYGNISESEKWELERRYGVKVRVRKPDLSKYPKFSADLSDFG